jgi:hypothetical protein
MRWEKYDLIESLYFIGFELLKKFVNILNLTIGSYLVSNKICSNGVEIQNYGNRTVPEVQNTTTVTEVPNSHHYGELQCKNVTKIERLLMIYTVFKNSVSNIKLSTE